MTDLAATDQHVLTRAADLDLDIREVCRRIRIVWIHLAADLHEFHDDKCWELLGYDSFDQWLAQSDIDLRRRHVYRLIEAHRELVLERKVSPEALEDVEITKVAVVLPALKRGSVDLEDALADVRALSRSDLVEKYRGQGGASLDAEGEPERAQCPSCGSYVEKARLA